MAIIDTTIATFEKYLLEVTSDADKTLLKRQITELTEIASSLSKYGTIRYRITDFEKLISDPWMENQTVYEKTYAAWKEFKDAFIREVSAIDLPGLNRSRLNVIIWAQKGSEYAKEEVHA